MKKPIAFLVTLILVSNFWSFAGDKLKEGKLTFEITMPAAEEMNDQVLAMMPKEMFVYFKEGRSRGEMTMMGSNIVELSDYKTSETITCMDFMGKKIAIKSTREDVDKEKSQMGEYDVKITEETKSIAGYTCKKAVITLKKDNNTMDIWFTNELESVNSAKYSWKGIDGAMLEFSTDQRGMAMKFSCTKVEKTEVSDDMFKVPEGYTIMTQEEATKQMGVGQ